MYYSHRGKPVDLDAYLAQHGDTPSVGNMSINARGDVIDGNGKVVQRAKTEDTNVQAKPRTRFASIKADELEKPEKFYTPSEIIQMAEEAQAKEEAEATTPRKPKRKTRNNSSKDILDDE